MVLLGCSAILSNGFVVAERGTSQIALVASASNIPVLIAAQTCKFVDRASSILFDTFCFLCGLKYHCVAWFLINFSLFSRLKQKYCFLLKRDYHIFLKVQSFSHGVHEVSALMGERNEFVAADLITALVTELRILPPSSAPAVLKAKQLAVDS